ncbi:MAG TPA: c-type cytochrome [Terriglobia bacterium]|nr:c-type cytochrome [Terriglobia bacterium]
MRLFLTGALVMLLLILVGLLFYLRAGYLDMRADIAPSRFESQSNMRFLDASVDRRAPDIASPVEPTDANLIEGIRLYKANCSMCHGAPGNPEKNFGHPFYPPAPQFMEDAPDMSEGENFYIIKHGIRWTGMPAWGSVLSDQQIWTITTFLSHMEKLPPAAEEEWQKPPTPPVQTTGGTPPSPGQEIPEGTPPAPSAPQ